MFVEWMNDKEVVGGLNENKLKGKTGELRGCGQIMWWLHEEFRKMGIFGFWLWKGWLKRAGREGHWWWEGWCVKTLLLQSLCGHIWWQMHAVVSVCPCFCLFYTQLFFPAVAWGLRPNTRHMVVDLTEALATQRQQLSIDFTTNSSSLLI